jgi:hypothetical protein
MLKLSIFMHKVQVMHFFAVFFCWNLTWFWTKLKVLVLVFYWLFGKLYTKPALFIMLGKASSEPVNIWCSRHCSQQNERGSEHSMTEMSGIHVQQIHFGSPLPSVESSLKDYVIKCG